MQKFDASVPRKMFWSQDVGNNLEACPECGTPLVRDYQTYMLSVRHADDIDMSVTGNDHGYFCPQCPTVVLDFEAFREMAEMVADEPARAQFAVLGLIDLEAIPEDKRDVPLGEDGSPVPLVKFLNDFEVTGNDRANQGKRPGTGSDAIGLGSAAAPPVQKKKTAHQEPAKTTPEA